MMYNAALLIGGGGLAVSDGLMSVVWYAVFPVSPQASARP